MSAVLLTFLTLFLGALMMTSLGLRLLMVHSAEIGTPWLGEAKMPPSPKQPTHGEQHKKLRDDLTRSAKGLAMAPRAQLWYV